MFVVKKSSSNPILVPNKKQVFDDVGSFNPSPVTVGKKKYIVYRAISSTIKGQVPEQMSTIGIAEKGARGTYGKARQLIAPEFIWEKYGCEDPRVVEINKKYFIFYTALGEFPFRGEGIKVAVAISKDMKTIQKKHIVTPFNAKAFGLFPRKINGKYYGILSVNTDAPPAKVMVVSFDTIEDMWNQERWKKMYTHLDDFTVELRRGGQDHVEVGAPPIWTEHGWLLIYSHIQNYFGGGNKIFGIEAVLLDPNDPRKVIGRTRGPIIAPDEPYELNGAVPNIVFPTGAEVVDDMLHIYYGAADESSAVATVALSDLVNSLCSETKDEYRFKRYYKNPIITPNKLRNTESGGVLNPAAIDLGGSIHILFRAFSKNATSTIGYAESKNGLDIDYRSTLPIYVPREDFELKKQPGNSGCEDPRLVKIGNRIYMFYTAYNGVQLPDVAVTSILEKDFLARNWQWTKPILVTPNSDNIDDKDTCILPEQVLVKGKKKWLILHRIGLNICADYLDSLDFEKDKANKCIEILRPRKDMWDSEKIGISAPPIKTKHGWLLTYHGISKNHHTYRVGIALLSLSDPTVVIARSTDPILEPEEVYEKTGVVPNVVFPCGLVERDGLLYIYYGGADKVVCVATMKLENVLGPLTNSLKSP
jgi:predicted GH43/DUF377 family glycosyl hydrolase